MACRLHPRGTYTLCYLGVFAFNPDKETGDYHLFMHKMGINSEHGLVGGLDYERTIKSDGERVEDIEQVPERIFDAMNTYLNQNL